MSFSPIGMYCPAADMAAGFLLEQGKIESIFCYLKFTPVHSTMTKMCREIQAGNDEERSENEDKRL